MKHRKPGRTLGRTAKNRGHLWRNMTSSLLEHDFLVTTEAKAKDLRRWFEPLVTQASGDLTLHRRRLLLSKLGKDYDLPLLVAVAKRVKKRHGGYLRLTKLPTKRSDGAPVVRVDILDPTNDT